MADLYRYTYLNANGYLKKFQNVLGLPNLNRGQLTKYLQVFNKRYNLKGFIVKDDNGYNALYYKDTLNAILGVDRTGYEVTKPQSNPYLKYLRDIIDEIDYKEYEKGLQSQPEDTPINYSSEDSDMQKVSDKLVYADNYALQEQKLKITESELIQMISEAVQKLIDENYELEATYPSSFNMEYFKSLKSFNQRIKYCQAYLQRLSSGSSRIVFKIDDNTVLKLAKNQKGIAQNEVEGQPDYYRSNIGCFAEVYERDENYLWIEMQLARKAKLSDFKRITGYDFQTVCYWIEYCKPDRYRKTNPLSQYFESEEFQDNWDEYGLLAQLQEYIGNYDVPIGDLERISSWGVVKDNDGEQMVLIDYGLTEDVFNDYYRKRLKQ